MDNEAVIRRFKSGVISIEGRTSDENAKILKEFMHADFNKWEIGDNRGGLISVEFPPIAISKPAEWEDSLEKILKPEWYSLHPKLRRRKIITRFVPKLADYKAGVETGGNATIPRDGGKLSEHWIRIPMVTPWGDLTTEQDALFTLVHELTEIDFWQKTTTSEWRDRFEEDLQGIELLKMGKAKEYNQLTDERIANLRAEKALRRKWPEYTFVG